MERIMFAGMAPLALQKITLNNSTAVALNSTTRGAQVVVFSVETTDARMRADATAPTNTTGVVFTAGNTFILDGYNGTSNFRFARSGTSGTSTITVQPFKHFSGL